MASQPKMIALAAFGAAALTGASAAASDGGDSSFTIAAIPDTQIQSVYPAWGQSFADQTGWLRNNADRENIAFVSHLGDLVQGPFGGVEQLPSARWTDQWSRADTFMSQLDLANTADGRHLPYSASLGNHDVLDTGDKSNPDDPVPGGAFREYFGPSRYQDYSWYGGSDPTGWNHYQTIQAGEYEYLHINLEHEPDNPTNDAGISRIEGVNDALNWAQSVIENHPGMPTIISTHESLTDLESAGDTPAGYQGDGADDTFGQGERTGHGQAIWDRLVKDNSQVFMVLNGHEHEGPYREDGEYHQVSQNEAGLPVFEVLVNHQDYTNPLTGNDPYLRLIEFDPEAGEIRNKTFSPTFDAFNNDPATVEQRLDDILTLFDSGLPIPIFDENEDLQDILATSAFPALPGDTADSSLEAEQALLDFFGVDSRRELRGRDFSPYLTDRDSQFTFDELRFTDAGRPRPIPAPGSLCLLAAGGAAALVRRRRNGMICKS